MFCNFDGCYSKRADREVSDLVDRLELLRQLQHAATSRRSDAVRTQRSARALQSDSDEAILAQQRQNQWTNACCPPAAVRR